MMCDTEQLSFEYLQEPTGACGAEELENRATVNYYCRFEGSEDIFHSTGQSIGCTPYSCFGEGGLQVGCSTTSTESVTATGGSGIAAGWSGSWTSSTNFTWTWVEPTEIENYFLLAGTFSFEMQGDFELADGSVAPDGVFLENPSPGANVSGISPISGWSCLGGELEVEFSDADGVIGTVPVLHGSERGDTEPVCGDIDNGFSATFNWNLLGSGEKTARLIRNGEEVKKQTFMVTAFDTEFVTGAEGMCTITDFPDMGKNATFVWEQSQQGLVLESVN